MEKHSILLAVILRFAIRSTKRGHDENQQCDGRGLRQGDFTSRALDASINASRQVDL
ncbi:hypothetical protein [Burkholderia gladioli]|uniref:hypothetical protein n=1 Tax=Burkholderia gladioli TaxID=28095 RepID=UPI000A87C271|nr:hypothetical protein [Burkholderia gladioli]MDN7495893.1 hypothetical protein [Burkholderia gladioli]MDN7599009.1 hypothetical protein [Burkholderia gladioli]